MYVCKAQDRAPRSHCAEQGLRQCDYCAWYQNGHGDAHYPVPTVYKETLDPDFQGWEIVWQNLLFYPPWRTKRVRYDAQHYPL